MKKQITILSLAVLSSAFAQDITRDLDFYGDTISKALLRHGHIQSKNDVNSIQEVLRLNQLNWESAKKLPVGYNFYVSKGKRIELAKDESSNNSITKRLITKSVNRFSVEFGSFYHNQAIGSANIYSDLSQYATVQYTYDNSIYAQGDIKRFAYSKDTEQNLNSDSEQYTHDIRAGKLINTKYASFGLGAYTKSMQTFGTDSLNVVSIDKANSHGLHANVKADLYKGNKLTWFAGLDLQKNLSSNKLNDYLAGVSQLGTSFKYNKNNLSVILRYGFSTIENETDKIDDQMASLGLRTLF